MSRISPVFVLPSQDLTGLRPFGAVQLPQHRRFEVQPLAAFARGDPLGRQAQGGAASEAEVVPVGHLRRGALWGFSGMKGKKKLDGWMLDR